MTKYMPLCLIVLAFTLGTQLDARGPTSRDERFDQLEAKKLRIVDGKYSVEITPRRIEMLWGDEPFMTFEVTPDSRNRERPSHASMNIFGTKKAPSVRINNRGLLVLDENDAVRAFMHFVSNRSSVGVGGEDEDIAALVLQEKFRNRDAAPAKLLLRDNEGNSEREITVLGMGKETKSK